MSFIGNFKNKLEAIIFRFFEKPYNNDLLIMASILTSLAMLLLPSNDKVAIAGISFFQIRVIVFELYGFYLLAVYPSAKRDAPMIAYALLAAIPIVALVVIFSIYRSFTAGA